MALNFKSKNRMANVLEGKAAASSAIWQRLHYQQALTLQWKVKATVTFRNSRRDNGGTPTQSVTSLGTKVYK